jgi:3-oxoacyl-[acyl-carrier-protein] synthase II
MATNPPTVGRAQISGLGVVTGCGSGPEEFFEALCAGRSGLSHPPEDHPLAGIVEAAAFAPPIDPASVAPPTEARCVDRFIVLALTAADAALADAAIVVGRDVDPARAAVVLANGFGGLSLFENQVTAYGRGGRTAVSPYLLGGMLPNMAAARIAIRHGIRGYTAAPALACASGAYAVAEGLRLIRDGHADVVVAGGTEAPLLPTVATAFRNARALATGWAEPADASRPFDRRRNGLVLGEGAGVLVLERPGHAAARGRGGYADVVGWGVSTDAYHPTAPRPDGTEAARCIAAALADAALGPADVDYLNAHGTGTRLGDAAEARAIRAVFRDPPPVSSTKAVTGHLLAASGAVEAVATAIAIHRGLLPPTHNLDDPDPECDLDHIRKAPRRAAVRSAVSTSFGFGGHNVSLVLAPAATAWPFPRDPS